MTIFWRKWNGMEGLVKIKFEKDGKFIWEYKGELIICDDVSKLLNGICCLWFCGYM